MVRIRPFRTGDEPALTEICLRTADAGGDATGLFEDDAVWANVFALPYVARHPDFAFVVDTGGESADDAASGRVAGYVVGAPDTDAFERWFRDEWWPRFADRWPMPHAARTPQERTLLYAYGRRPGLEPYAAEYPAHLHIDLLPELQGGGWGRRLIATLEDRLRAADVPGLHLVAASRNTGALAFYPRVGFTPLASPPGVQAFGKTL